MIIPGITIRQLASMILVTAVNKLAKATHGTKRMNAVPTAIIV